MAREVVTFDQFGKGEYGLLGEQRAPAGTFTGTNVLPYIDGSIGPRCGLKDLAPTGVTTGAVKSFGFTRVPDHELWFCVGTNLYNFDAGSTGNAVSSAYSTGLASTPTKPLGVAQDAGGVDYMASYGDKTYQVNHTARSITALGSSPGGRCAAIYGDFLMVGGDNSNGNRLHYSAAGDFTTWPGNYIDIGDAWAIVALYPMRQNLLIVKEQSLYMLTGTPGVDDQVRRIAIGTNFVPFNRAAGEVLEDSTLWFVPQQRDYPCAFNDGVTKQLDHLSFAAGNASDTAIPPGLAVCAGRWRDEFAVVSGIIATGATGRVLLHRGGAFSYHTVGVTISGFALGGPQGTSNYLYFCDAGGASAAAKFYAMRITGDRPPLSSVSLESLGDASSTAPSCEFTLPEWYMPKGEQEVQVTAVVVDFVKWGHGFGGNNTFTVEVTPLRQTVLSGEADVSATGTAATASFTEVATSASATGTSDRRKLTFSSPPPAGHGFRLKVSGIVGCSIQRLHVVFESRPNQDV